MGRAEKTKQGGVMWRYFILTLVLAIRWYIKRCLWKIMLVYNLQIHLILTYLQLNHSQHYITFLFPFCCNSDKKNEVTENYDKLNWFAI